MSLMHKLMGLMPGSISCKEVNERLDDYLAGELSLWNRFRMRFHFVICEACRLYLEGYNHAIALMKSSINKLDDPSADETVDDALVQDILKASVPAPDTD